MAIALRPGRVGLPGVVELLLLLSDMGVNLPESGAKRCNASINAPAEPAWVVGFEDVRDMPTLFNRGATHAGCEQIRDERTVCGTLCSDGQDHSDTLTIGTPCRTKVQDGIRQRGKRERKESAPVLAPFGCHRAVE